VAEPGAAAWSARLVASAVARRPEPCVYGHLDRLLRWLAGEPGPESDELWREFERRGLERSQARTLCFGLLDAALFGGRDDDWDRALGYPRARELRDRYRRLMRVYHPDVVAEEERAWAERAERINAAYARLRDQGSGGQPVQLPPLALRRRRISRPHAWRPARSRPTLRRIQRRSLAAVFLLGVSLVVYSCVAHRAWHRWETAPATQARTWSPATQR
jgi:hypothetical protein